MARDSTRPALGRSIGSSPLRAGAVRAVAAALCIAAACTVSELQVSDRRSDASPSLSPGPSVGISEEEKTDLPDRTIAFRHRQGIYTANGDGSNRNLIARVPQAYAGPYWSSEARAFVVRIEKRVGKDRFHGLVYRVDLDGTVTNLSAKTGRTTDGMVGWAPDGEHVVFTSRPPGEDVPQLYVMDADGTNVKRLTDGDMETQYPAWSPDGQRIAFTGVADGYNFEIFVMNADGSGVERLTNTAEAENWSTWSPGSDQIAFSLESEVWAMNADGSDRRLVTVPDEAAGGEAHWSPDGEWIAFNCSIDAPVICAIHPDGTGFTRLFGRAGFPFWMD
jgi:Tol biopolymer transport system component